MSGDDEMPMRDKLMLLGLVIKLFGFWDLLLLGCK